MAELGSGTGPVRVLGIADSDSYLKWLAASMRQLPAEWQKEIVLARGTATPSPAQVQAALAGTGTRPEHVRVQTLDEIRERVAGERPDVAFVATRGTMADLLLRTALPRGAARPVFLTGLPGISIPATRRGLVYRSTADLFLLHSKREVRDFARLAAGMPLADRFALATLPFIAAPRDADGRPRTDVIFAAQAGAPASRADRARLLQMLITLADSRPDLRVVIKLRAEAGEVQTHAESAGFPALLEEWEAATDCTAPTNLVFSTGAMAAHLREAAGLVTVSSTAVLEAIALGVPSIVLSDFGISAERINLVFLGSNLLAASDELLAARFRTVAPEWLDDNYFHDPAEDDWLRRLTELVAARRGGALPAPASSLVLREFSPRQRAYARWSALGGADSGRSSAAATLYFRASGRLRRYRRLVGRVVAGR